jgi:hypothetical protein
VTCENCGRGIAGKPGGRLRRFCSDRCRQAAYRARKAGGPNSLHLVEEIRGGTALDAHAALEALAKRLQAAHEAAPGNASLARELRMTLLALPREDGDDDDPLAELRALAGDVP